MKRIAYIGLSTPVFYDYRTQVDHAPSDMSDSPNPILDSPFGILLLYDELWFLCRSLCPGNMRNLPYIRFLDEDGVVGDIARISPTAPEKLFTKANLTAFHNSAADYYQTREKAGITWDAAPDNHTHGLNVAGAHVSGNSWSVGNVLLDTAILTTIGDARVEFITNTFTQRLFESQADVYHKLRMSEIMVVEDIPNYLARLGPYHPCIDEARSNSYLRDYRNWIATQTVPASETEKAEMKRDVEAAIADCQKRIFIKHLAPAGGYSTLGKTIVGVGGDVLLPGSSVLASLGEQLVEERKKQSIRWQGFVVTSKEILGHSALKPNKGIDEK